MRQLGKGVKVERLMYGKDGPLNYSEVTETTTRSLI